MRNDREMPTVSVIVPTYNCSATIEKCLESIISQDYPDLELIVVDDASGDDTLAKVSRYPVKIISQSKNYGAANSRNAGADRAVADYLIFVDSDIVLPPDAVAQAITKLLENNQILAVGGIYSAGPLGLNFISDFKNLDLAYRGYLCAGRVKYLGTSFLAIEKRIFLAAGGFPADLGGVVTEDIDFGYRVTKGKRQMFIDKYIRVGHLKRYSLLSMLKTDFKRIISMMAIIKKSKGRYLAGEHAPLTYKINLFLPGLILLSMPIGVKFGAWLLPALLASAFIINNSGFLRFLFKKRGIIFSFKSMPTLFIEYIVIEFSLFTSIFA